MTVREATDLLIYLGAAAGAIFAIWVVLRTFVVNPIKAHAGEENKDLKQSITLLDAKVEGLGNRISDHIQTHGQLVSFVTVPVKLQVGRGTSAR